MAKTIGTSVPHTIVPGDSVSWYHDVDETQYPTDTYTLTYTISDGSTSISAVGSVYDSNTYLVTLASGITAGLTADKTYGYTAVVAYPAGGLSYTISHGTIRAGLSSTADPRSFYEKALDSIEAVIEGRASEVDLSYSIGSGSTARSLSKMSFNELISARSYFLRKLKALRRKEKTGTSYKSYRLRG